MNAHYPSHLTPRFVRLLAFPEGEVLVTEALPGTPASAARWRPTGELVAIALATGLRKLHSLQSEDCPFDWSASARVAAISTSGFRLPSALLSVPETDIEVLSHGEAFLPNVLLSDSGVFVGHVDLARLGRADRWADLAAAALSLEWNYPAQSLSVFWETYGVAPDKVRLAYYKALWLAIESQQPWLSTSSTSRSNSEPR